MSQFVLIWCARSAGVSGPAEVGVAYRPWDPMSADQSTLDGGVPVTPENHIGMNPVSGVLCIAFS
jgi:hypothetical protein